MDASIRMTGSLAEQGDTQSSPVRHTRVFLSYSRHDLDFAERLVATLTGRGFEAFLDKIDIAPGEPWKERLSELIAHSDTVVFVLSPASIESEICGWEVAEALRLGKRLMPVVHQPVSADRVPADLARLNFILFTEGESFDSSLGQLVTALESDIGWVREHTRLAELAQQWQTRNRRRTETLRGSRLEAAERWLALQPSGASVPTDLHRAFILASRQAAVRRQRLWGAGLLAAAIVAGGLALWADVNRREADRQKQIAVSSERLARDNEALARANERRAVAGEKLAQQNESRANEQRDQALLTQSRFLTDLARQQLDEGKTTAALLLALEALPDAKSGIVRPYLAHAENALYRSIHKQVESALITAHSKRIFAVRWLDDRRFLSASRDDLKIWDADTQRELFSYVASRPDWKFPDDAVVAAAITGDQSLIVLSTVSGRVDIIDVAEQRLLRFFATGHRPLRGYDDALESDLIMTMLPLQTSAKFGQRYTRLFVDGLVISPDNRWVAKTDEEDGAQWLRIYALADGKLQMEFKAPTFFAFTNSVVWSEDSRRLFWPLFESGVILDLKGATNRTTISLPTSRLSRGDSNRDVSEQERKIGQLLASNRPVFARFNDNGETLQIVTLDGRALLYDTADGEEVRNFNVHDDIVHAADLSPDGKILVTGSADKTARIWDVVGGKLISEIRGHTEAVRAVSIDVSGTVTATIADDGSARIWLIPSDRPTTPQQWGIMRGHGNTVSHSAVTAFDARSTHVLTGHIDGSLRLWPIDNSFSTRLKTEGSVTAFSAASVIRFSPDGKRILTTEGDSASLWDRATGARLASLTGHTSLIRRASFDSSGQRIVTASYDHTVRVWNGETGAFIDEFGIRNSEAISSRTGRGRRGRPPRPHEGILGYEQDDISTKWAGDFARFEFATFSPDGRLILAANAGGSALLWAPEAREYDLLEFEGEQNYDLTTGTKRWITAGAFSPNGKLIATGSFDGVVQLWDLERGERGIRLAAGADDPKDTLTGNKVITFVGFYPDGRRLLVARGDGTILSYYVELPPKSVATTLFGYDTSGNPHGSIGITGKHVLAVLDAAISSDGKLVVTAGADNSLHLWDAMTGKQLWHALDHTGSIYRVRFTPDNRRVVAGSEDGWLSIWDVTTGQRLAVFEHGAAISDIDVSPDGQTIASVAPNGARLWRIFPNTQELVDLAKQRVQRCLTRWEREEFSLDRMPPGWCLDLKKYPYRRVRIGASLRSVSAEDVSRLKLSAPRGAIVTNVLELSPAFLSGLVRGDVIRKVGEADVAGPNDVVRAVSSSPIYAPLKLEIIRNARAFRLEIVPSGEE